MPKKVDVESMLAESLVALMKKVPIKDILVSDIVEHCNLSRRTFYNRFRDKYDLLEWVYKSHNLLCRRLFGEYISWYRFTLEMAKTVKANKDFYGPVFKELWLIEKLAAITREDLVGAIRRNQDIRTVDRGDKKLRRIYFLTDFYAHAFVRKLADWVNYGFRETPAELLDLFFASVPDELRQLLAIPAKPDV